MTTPTFIDVGGRRIATLLGRPAKPSRTSGVVWLPGLKSDMTSTKASAIAAWAALDRTACTRFD